MFGINLRQDEFPYIPYQSAPVMTEFGVFCISLMYDGTDGAPPKTPLFARILENTDISHVLTMSISGSAFSQGKWK